MSPPGVVATTCSAVSPRANVCEPGAVLDALLATPFVDCSMTVILP
ncbi:hypothetical protein [Mycolicibacterium confluentis]|nr:hypothetical protein [Mycolicibacterium confluentis]